MKNEHNVVLDYDGQLFLESETPDLGWLESASFYKIRLKSKVERIEGNKAFFRTSLTYPDYIKINQILENKLPGLGYDYCETERLKDYIANRNLYIEKRCMLGTELKTDATRLTERYLKFKTVVENAMERPLREQQMQNAFFMYAMARSANFSVPGSGKTSSALAVYAFLREKNLADRIVVIGPKNSFGPWMDEFRLCFGDKLELNCFNVQDIKYKNTADKMYALLYECGNCNLFLFNYESVASLERDIIEIISKRTLLVFDEVHRVKRVDGQYATHALNVSKQAPYIIAMTGTPIPNSYLDLYNLLHILFHDEYKDFFNFDSRMLKNPEPSEVELINDKIQPFFCRVSKKDLSVPDAEEDLVYQVHAADIEQRLFEIVLNTFRANRIVLFIRLLQMESDPKMLFQRLDFDAFSEILDISGEIDRFDFVDYSGEMRELINGLDRTGKRKQCLSLAKTLVDEGKKVVIWCIFRESIQGITDDLNKMGIASKAVYGEVPLDERVLLADSFKKSEFDVLVTNPHTLAESVSLHTICHDAIYYEYSYNLVHLLQSKDRIHRLGLPSEQYTQYHFMQCWFKQEGDDYSMDERVYQRLKEKEQVMLDAIDNHHLEPVCTPEEDLEIIFKGIL